ncbi:hypothetical protein KADA111694_11010 [Kaistella daneshvariae]
MKTLNKFLIKFVHSWLINFDLNERFCAEFSFGKTENFTDKAADFFCHERTNSFFTFGNFLGYNRRFLAAEKTKKTGF